MKLSFDKLFEAFEVTCFGDPETVRAYVNRENGEIYIVSDSNDDLDGEDIPEDLFENEIYFLLPDPSELTSGRDLAFKFASAEVRNHADEIYEIFQKGGAFSRFKDLLAHIGKLEDWYVFEQKTQQEELREWCEFNEIEVEN